MARVQHLPPSAASLTASFRDLGYSLETAIADVIDNSIAADSTEIKVFCDASRREPVLAIVDNGHGMNESEVVNAMRHGTADPRRIRGAKDLGRFGLGLKTASFSQCRRLTIISAFKGERSGAEWSLAQIEAENDWNLSVLEKEDIESQPCIDMLGDCGTLVIWRELDRLLEIESEHKRDEILNEKLSIVEKHLALVFHRFLAGELKGRRKLSISINGRRVVAFDPFCRKNEATQLLCEEKVWIGEIEVSLRAFILPHHSRLTELEYEFYRDRSDFISNQGAYVYRNGRLMVWGDWFRLVTKSESTKLARVQIDFPNSLDEDWTIDIKKSRARPPHLVRERLKQILVRIVARSVTVHRGRGERLYQEVRSPVWERYAGHGGIRFAINMEHPIVATLLSRLAVGDAEALRMLLESISASLPVEMIYSDYSTSPREMKQHLDSSEKLPELLVRLKSSIFGDMPGEAEVFRQVVRSSKIFEGHLEAAEKFIEETFK